MATRRTDSAPAKPDQTASKAPARRASRPKTPSDPPSPTMSEQARRTMIAEAAYYHAERRGFVPGSEEHDWLRAEAEVDSLLKTAAHGRRPQ
jgi:hypothetical protein